MRDWLFDHPKRRQKLVLFFKLVPLIVLFLIHTPYFLFEVAKHGKSIQFTWNKTTYAIWPYNHRGLWYQEIAPVRGRPFPLPIPYIQLDQCSLAAVLIPYGILWLRDQVRPHLKPLTPEERWLQKYDSMNCPICDYDIRATPDRCPECGSQIGAMAEEMRQRVKIYRRV